MGNGAVVETLDYHVRVADAGDVPGVEALLERSYPQLLKADYPPSVMVSAVPMLVRAQPALIGCGTYYVAETVGKHIVGAGGWTLRNPATGRREGAMGSIRHFATDPAVLRQGVGRQLMRRCLVDAIDAGMEGMLCIATRTAVRFYQAMGFRTTGEVIVELKPGVRFPAVNMRRDFEDGAS
ncbi:MAG: GNAT family N-acetyltransferase [Pseudomonadota bacterium]